MNSHTAKTLFLGSITALFVFILVSMFKSSKTTSDVWVSKNVGSQTNNTEPEIEELSDYCLDAPVVFYHHVQPLDKAEEKGQRSLSVHPSNFERDIQYLKLQGYNLISLDELVQAIDEHRPLENAVVVVLDDGYRDNYVYAYPIAKRNNAQINIGIITGLVGHEEHLTWNMIHEMHDSGLVHMYNHSWSHMSLHQANASTIYAQVTNAQEHLEDRSLTNSKIMIYPYGRTGETVQDILAEENFRAAFTVEEGTKHCESTRYELPRLRTGNAGVGIHGL